jgi:vacuolar-type H+-ATPase subunit I/STV1
MDTEGGKETYRTVKNLEELGEWSFGFDRLDQEPGVWNGQHVNFLKQMQVHEVSPVLLGAGIGTRTTAMKSADGEHNNWPEHHENCEEETCPADYQKCLSVIAKLNGARGGIDLSAEEKKALYDHIAEHIRENEEEPPELKSVDAENLTLSAHAGVVAEEIRGLSERLQELYEDRKNRERKVSEKSAHFLLMAQYEALKAVDVLKVILSKKVENTEDVAVLSLIKAKLEGIK